MKVPCEHQLEPQARGLAAQFEDAEFAAIEVEFLAREVRAQRQGTAGAAELPFLQQPAMADRLHHAPGEDIERLGGSRQISGRGVHVMAPANRH